MTKGRLVQQTADEWVPLVMEYVAVLDLRADDLTARFGWTWAEGEEVGLGRMKYAGLAYDGRSRYVLIASVDEPGRGVALEAAEYEELGSKAGDPFGTEVDRADHEAADQLLAGVVRDLRRRL